MKETQRKEAKKKKGKVSRAEKLSLVEEKDILELRSLLNS